jgi:hypothetical protein
MSRLRAARTHFAATQFEGGLFCCRLFARFEILADAEAVKPSLHPPGRDTVPILKSADGKLRVIHA